MRQMTSLRFTVFLYYALFSHFNQVFAKEVPGPHPDLANVVFFIGDGMGIASVTGGRIWAHGANGSLNIEQMPFSGFAKTFSSSDFVTDSAAAATALATGVKTYNGAIGLSDPVLDPTGKSRSLETLVDVAKRMGKSVGIVSTAKVTHATPASFYAHVPSREQEEEIAEQVITSNVDLLMGGGREAFLPQRKDKRNLIEGLKKSGWKYLESKQQMRGLKTKLGDRILGLFSEDHLAYDLEREEKQADQPSLQEMVDFAVDHLSKNPKGFFLMVEGGRIDHAAHDNNPKNIFGEMHAFDNAIGSVLKRRQKDTLILVTADHETGGLALNGYKSLEESKGEGILGKVTSFLDDDRHLVSFASGPGAKRKKDDLNLHPALYFGASAAHTAVDVPVVASGPGAQFFSGFLSNEDIPWRISQLWGVSFREAANLENHGLLDKKRIKALSRN